MPRIQRTKPAPASIVPPLLAWFRAHARDLPWRRTRDSYAIWVSEIMLQQTQVKTVIPYWERWMRELPNIEHLAAAPEPRVLKLWEGLGYYSRARNLQKAARLIHDSRGGRFPEQFSEVLELPGIGRYTAGAICSIAFNQPTPILDGNVIRVLTRMYALRGDPKASRLNERLWRLAGDLVKESTAQRHGDQACSHTNQALMELGATLCTPSKPDCAACPVSRGCRGYALGRAAAYPTAIPRVRTTARTFATLLLVNGERWLVRKRPAGEVNGSFWEFPSLEVTTHDDARTALAGWLKLPAASLEHAGQLRHTITRFRMTQEIFRSNTDRTRFPMLGGARWVTRTELEEFHLTGSHRRLTRNL